MSASPHPLACTLAEGRYLLGAGALANSLHRAGYRGELVVGYRGAMPGWAAPAAAADDLEVPSRRLAVAAGFAVRLVALDTPHHFTNHKPRFLLDLARWYPAADPLLYFDPDIVVVYPWPFFADWCRGAVALCEDVNSPMPASHPWRRARRDWLAERGFRLEPRGDVAVNGGFVGVPREHLRLCETWAAILAVVGERFGGLGGADIGDEPGHPRVAAPHDPFAGGDQAALNAALEACAVPTSLLGREGMGFQHGGMAMAHAIGAPKPWNKPYLRWLARTGKVPTAADRAYWQSVEAPIPVVPPAAARRARLLIRAAAFLGRFYGR